MRPPKKQASKSRAGQGKHLPKRKKIPTQTETELLVRCKYRCCLCFTLDSDNSEKTGQVAHIDHDSRNNDLSNLVFLCHDHHSRYDSKSLQSKSITEGFLRDSLERLLESQRLASEKRVTLTITIDRNFESFTPKEYAEFISNIRSLACTQGAITKLSVEAGSVKLKLEMSGEDVIRVLRAFKDRQLDSFGVSDVQYCEGIQSSIQVFDEFDFQMGILSKAQILSVVSNPDYSQPVLDRVCFSRLFVKDNFPIDGVATLAFVSKRELSGWVLMRGLVIPKMLLESCPIDRPRALLCEFADKFGIPLPKFDNAKIVFDKTLPILLGTVSETLGNAFSFRPSEAVFYNAIVSESMWGMRSISLEVVLKLGESYVKALNKCGFDIDLEKWKRRKHKTLPF